MAALLALAQIAAERAGTASPIATVGTTVLGAVEMGASAVVNGVGGFAHGVAALPGLERDVSTLRTENTRLTEENAQLHARLVDAAANIALQPAQALYHGIGARVVGFPPENESRAVTVSAGSHSGVARDDGVVTPDGAVGRVVSVGPITSEVLLLTDYTSRIPAIVRRGHWWGIARGNLSSIRVEYIAQDAPIRIGDMVVTGEGRSFHAGVPIGRIVKIERGDATLYQTAIVKPAADPGALDRVLVLTRGS